MSNFDPQIALAELVAGQPPHKGRHLSFTEQCAALAALKAGVRTLTVQKAFDITSATASFLKNCEASPNGRPRYAKVAREFLRLGDRAFMEKYYTDAVHVKLQRIKYNVAEPGDIRNPTAPSPLARSKAFSDLGSFSQAGEYWRVDWLANGRDGENVPGWYFSHCDQNGQLREDSFYQGKEALGGDPAPYRTSQLAYDAVFKATTG